MIPVYCVTCGNEFWSKDLNEKCSRCGTPAYILKDKGKYNERMVQNIYERSHGNIVGYV